MPGTPPTSPLRWFGGKARLAATIAAALPPHVHYAEPFAGSAAVLFAKTRSTLETLNDLDGDVVNLFTVLRTQADQLAAAVALTPYAREEFTAARAAVAAGDAADAADPVERARLFLTAVQMSQAQSPIRSGFSYAVAPTGGSSPARKWARLPDRLAAAADRLAGVQIERRDWRDVLARYDRPGTLFYCDPPYHPDTRTGGGYRHELAAADHDDLVAALLRTRGAVVLSGYAHPAYAPLEDAGWTRRELTSVNTAAARRGRTGRAATECLWLSPTTGDRPAA